MNINKTNIQAIHNVLYTDLQRRMFRQYNARTDDFNISDEEAAALRPCTALKNHQSGPYS